MTKKKKSDKKQPTSKARPSEQEKKPLNVDKDSVELEGDSLDDVAGGRAGSDAVGDEPCTAVRTVCV